MTYYVSNNRLAARLNVIFQIAALSTMIIAMRAVVKHKEDIKEDALTTIHSWSGIEAIVMFCISRIYEILLHVFRPENSTEDHTNLNLLRRGLGLTAFGLTTVAVLTGIMNRMGRGGCNYLLDTAPQPDSNPSKYYGDIPNACKISNGLGVVVIIIAVLTVIIVSLSLNRAYNAVISSVKTEFPEILNTSMRITPL